MAETMKNSTANPSDESGSFSFAKC